MILRRREQNAGAFISFWAITLFITYICFSFVGFSSEEKMLMTIGIVMVSSAIFCIIVLRKYRKEQNPQMIDYLNIGTQRYILAILMVLYGIAKVFGVFFDYQLFALDSKLADISEFQLAWYFYGKSHWQELFTGIMELVPALFLLRRRTYYIAAIICCLLRVRSFCSTCSLR